MPQGYQPFLIANLQTGLELGLPPWLMPLDAYTELNNAYLDHGVLYKRRGYAPFDSLGGAALPVSAEVAKAANSYGQFQGGGWFTEPWFGPVTGTLAHHPVVVGSLVLISANETFTDNGDGTLSGTGGGTGTIDYGTGAWTLIFGVDPQNSQILTDYYDSRPCMGIFNYTNSNGAEELLCWDTRRMYRFNEDSQKFEDASGSDLWGGEDYHFFWMANWLNRGFICNGFDRIRMYDGSTAALMTIDLSEPPDGVNDLDSAYLIFVYKDHLVLLRTQENGVNCPQRARWSTAGTYSGWDPLDYVDAPTHEWIVGAAFVRNELVVFFERSVWKLSYTGDSRLPFRWVRLAPNEGLIAKMSLNDFSNEAVGLGPTQLIGSDGVDVYNLDDRIPRLVLTMNQGAQQYAYAAVVDELNQAWTTYPSLNAMTPDNILVLNYEEKSFSIYNLPMFVFGYYQKALHDDPTWNSDDVWENIEYTWGDRTLQGGYPLTLGGDHAGNIFKMNTGGDDNGQPIEMIVASGRWNPFIKDGKRARLGYVDFLVERDPACDLTVQYFLDHENAPYQTDTFSLDDGSGSEKIWIRSFVGCEAQFHRLRLYNKAVNQTIVIHAIMPWFAEGGRIGP